MWLHSSSFTQSHSLVYTGFTSQLFRADQKIFIGRTVPFLIFSWGAYAENNGPEHKRSQSQQTLPSLHIFHVHCTAWLLEPTPGVNTSPQDPVPSGLCHEFSLRPRHFGWSCLPSFAAGQEEKAWGPSFWFQVCNGAGDQPVGWQEMGTTPTTQSQE